MLVNLGIGLPTAVSCFVPPGMNVFFQSVNGIIGFGASPPEGMEVSQEMVIHAGSINRDHVHMLLSIPPQLSVFSGCSVSEGEEFA